MALVLVFADLFWSLAAFWYDWGKLSSIPFYLLPFILTCPIYPLLLAIVWYQLGKKRRVNSFIFTLATLGSAIYGICALFYYPSEMYLYGINFLNVGAILWVLFYSVQGWYLIFRHSYKVNITSLIIAGALILLKIIIDYSTRTSGYIIDSLYPQLYLDILLAISIATFALALVSLTYREYNYRQ